MFIVALCLPWCKSLAVQESVGPQLYANNLQFVFRDPGVLLRGARFTTGYVRLVVQERAPSKCVCMSTSRITDDGDKWTVKLDARDFGWSATLAARV